MTFGNHIKNVSVHDDGYYYNIAQFRPVDSQKPNSIHTAAQKSTNAYMGTNIEHTALGSDLERAVDEIIKAYSERINITRNNALKLICTAAGVKDIKELKPHDVEKFKKVVIETLKHCNSNCLDTIAKNVNKFGALIRSGWDSISSFMNAQSKNKDSLTERVRRFDRDKNSWAATSWIRNHTGIDSDGGIDIRTASEEDRKAALKLYFQDYLKDKSVEVIKTDFAKLVYNSSPEEIQYIKEALAMIKKECTSAALDACLSILDDFADNLTADDIQTIATTPDSDGKKLTKDETRDITVKVKENQSEEAIKRDLERINQLCDEFFTDDNIKKYKELKAKATLTADEQEFIKNYETQYNFIVGYRAGQKIGTALNTKIDDVVKKTTLIQMNHDDFEHAEEAYEDILRNTVEYIEEHEEELGEAKEELEELLDETTDGNYKKVKEYLEEVKRENKNNPPAKPYLNRPRKGLPSKMNSGSNCGAKVSTGQKNENTITEEENTKNYDAYSDNIRQNNTVQETADYTAEVKIPAAETKSNINKQTPASAQKTENNQQDFENAVRDCKNITDVKRVAKENNASRTKTIVTILNISNVAKYLQSWAVDNFKRLITQVQVSTFNSITNGANAIMLADNMGLEALNKLDCQNSYVKKRVENRKEMLESIFHADNTCSA